MGQVKKTQTKKNSCNSCLLAARIHVYTHTTRTHCFAAATYPRGCQSIVCSDLHCHSRKWAPYQIHDGLAPVTGGSPRRAICQQRCNSSLPLTVARQWLSSVRPRRQAETRNNRYSNVESMNVSHIYIYIYICCNSTSSSESKSEAGRVGRYIGLHCRTAFAFAAADTSLIHWHFAVECSAWRVACSSVHYLVRWIVFRVDVQWKPPRQKWGTLWDYIVNI